jgi:hypothetical protein
MPLDILNPTPPPLPDIGLTDPSIPIPDQTVIPSNSTSSLLKNLGGVGDILSGLIDLNGAGQQANADIKQGQFQSQQLELNAQLADLQGKEAGEKGQFESELENAKTAGIEGQQKTSYASENVNSNFGSARAVQQETSNLGGMDSATIAHNANMEAWGYKIKAQNEETEAAETTIAAENKANQTMLGGTAGFITSGIKAIGAFGGV